MKKLLSIFTLGALLASGSGQLLADDRRHGGYDRRDDWGYHEYRGGKHHGKHYRKHHRKHHGHDYRHHDRRARYYHHPGWRSDDRYFGLYFGVPGVNISLRHYHDGRACYDRHRH